MAATVLEEGGGSGGDGGGGGGPGVLLVRVHVPELNVQKCLQFPREQRIWDVKQQCLAALPKELKESFNYGLFCPPENGRAGKFLDEERRLGDYPFNGPVGYLELKYKRRVYKMISLDEKQLKSLHTRANLRRFLDYVQNGHVEKITKMCDKGLDPNFHCQDSGETPLTIATGVKKPGKVLMALVNGGALLDYRSKDGSTAMHRAVERRSLEALRTLLELGASPNYRDGRGLTPLYLAVANQAESEFVETLLHDHATTGAKDAQGWQEVHQACKIGLLPHLEHLLFYGADMNARNASGNTPLHVCAVNGQESCARQLLFRGADKHALNYANQTPAQVAVIAGNMELADLIQNYSAEDIVPFRGPPSYNPRRRSALGWVGRPPPPPSAAAAGRGFPPSPCPSDRSSSAPFSSASSSLSDGGSSLAATHGQEAALDTASIVTEKSLGEASDVVSDSSGVGTAASSDTNTNCGVSHTPSSMTPPAVSMPTGSTVVCVESYTSEEEGHISIREGELIEVTGATDDGFLEGSIRSGGGARSGLFPARHVQEVRLRHRALLAQPTGGGAHTVGRVVGRRESLQRQPPGQQQFATAPRAIKKGQPNPGGLPPGARVVIVHRGRRGFGFVLKGARRALAEGAGTAPAPPPHWPSLQYVDNVEQGGAAAVAGLRRGDFLLRVGQEDVTSATHDRVVELIVAAGKLLVMTVISLQDHVSTTLPMSRSTILPGNMTDDSNNARQYAATLPRKMSGGTLGRQSQAPLPPRRDPRTTLSVGRARAKSMVAGLGGEGNREDVDELAKSSSAESIHQLTSGTTTATSTPVPPRTASIKQRPTSARLSQLELEELFKRDKELAEECGTGFTSGTTIRSFTGSPTKGRAYASVAEMKRSKIKSARQRFQEMFSGRELNRTFHSTPDLTQDPMMAYSHTLPSKSHRSQEDLAALTGVNRTLPPNHPPPPPPQFQLIKVGAPRNALGEYDTLSREEGIASSFRPTTSAKLYASPDNSKDIYQRKTALQHSSRPHLRKSQSMRTNSVGTPPGNTGSYQQHTNPYAQPIRASRSNSSASNGKERRKKLVQSKSTSSVSTLGQGVPSIPEPDYSCTDSEGECDNERKDVSSLAARLSSVQLQPVENSGNSNTSGSSTGSAGASSTGSAPAPNITVEDIQRGRSLLRSSKSYPEDFLKDGGRLAAEDGDNSSSGVSSDQEIGAPTGPAEYADRLTHHDLGNMTLPQQKTQQRPPTGLTRHAVSLAQLPPPLETETDEEFCLPPPPEFVEGVNAANVVQSCEEVVVAPPPQFSDSRQITRVRIVGAVPKAGGGITTPVSSAVTAKAKPGRLHSQ